MRRCLICALIFPVILSLSAQSALAGKQLTARRLDAANIKPVMLPGSAPSQTCQVGNTNSPSWAIPDFVMPPEHYKVVFDPQLTCGACLIGIEVLAVHVMIQTTEACDITMSADVEEVSFLPEAPDCPRPGVVWCASGSFLVELPGAGMWDVILPIECPCLTDERLYCIGITFDNVSCLTGTTPELITDEAPTVCTNWNDFGTGWEDLVVAHPGWPGGLLFKADADCCSVPLPVKGSTWGHIKSLYDQ